MKTRNFQNPRLTIATLTLALMTANVRAQDSATPSSADSEQPTAVSQAAPQLPYGVSDVMKLSQAKVDDGTIINYIRNSGNNYGLNATEIIYLRQQGVSSAVINAMLDQRSQLTPTTSTAAPSQTAGSTTYIAPVSTVVTQPAVTYVQTVPSSSVYIIPDTQTYQYNSWLYYHSPYYNCYPTYGYCWPRSTVSVCYIGSRGWVGYRGGYHGGWHSGGFHSSGWHHR